MNKKFIGFIFGLVFFGLFAVNTVNAADPIITSLSPSNGNIGSSIIINGTNFAGITKVFFGNIDAGGFFTVDSPSKITVIVPNKAVTAKVSLLTSKGEVFSPGVFTINSVAKITSFSPTSLQIGQTVTINGEGFNTVDGVLFGTVDAGLDFKVVSINQITAKVPANAVSGKITVKTTSNGNAVSSNSFSIYIPFGSANLDYSALNVIITEANAKLDNSALIEGTTTGQYIVGSKATLKTAVESAKSVSSGGSSNLQSDIDKATSDLRYALNNFELSKVGSSGGPGTPAVTKKVDYSKSIVPRCNVGGVTEIDQETGQYKVPCDFNYFMKLINNIIKFLLFVIAAPFLALIIMYVGYLYLTSGGSNQTEKAKQILFRVVIGYVIALGAWLIVSTIISNLKVDPTINTFMGEIKK